MTKSPASSSGPRLCPTCGTRVGAAATKCLVCGADLTLKAGARPPAGRARMGAPGVPARMPTLLLLAIPLLVLAAGAAGFWAANNNIPAIAGLFGGDDGTATATRPAPTATTPAPPTFTPRPTETETPEPTPTELPPVEYVVQSGQTCLAIAAEHNVSVASIITLNGLDPNCTLSVNQRLLIPQPTATPSPYPTATLNAVAATQVPRTTYTVHAGDTLQGIANFYGISVLDLMEVNGISDPNSIKADQVLIIPVERAVTPGPSPTPTPPPPWPAPNALLPANGQHFPASETQVTLQWTSVGTLRPNEYYFVVVEDVTCNCARFYRQATTETKVIVPLSFRHTEAEVHSYVWTVTTVRQRDGTSAQPEYDPAGATSPSLVFSWVGGAGTPAP